MEKIRKKESYSIKRLEEFKSNLSDSPELKNQENLCIYTTGSYGRLEASQYSDIDLFFLYSNGVKEFPKIDSILINSHIIRVSRKMGFPDFTDDGEYLVVHKADDLVEYMGSPKDDYYNYFTARMLLLLESKVMHNEAVYNDIIAQAITSYYKDFHKHEKNFKPIFIVNDIIRFWRTMCLNYEHSRNRKFSVKGMTPEDKEKKRNESHIKNLKLRFSRKLTCYSFLLRILFSEKKVLSMDDIRSICSQTPLQRLEELLITTPEIKDEVSEMIELYLYFLDTTQIDKSRLIDWIATPTNRNLVFDKSREFAKSIYNAMMKTKPHDSLMYFIV